MRRFAGTSLISPDKGKEKMKILIVSLRYLGDCLLAAALAPAIKEKLPDAQVDLLTFRDNRGILEGITAIDNVIGVERHPNKFRQALDHLRSWNDYDWALATMNSTRSTFYSWASAKHQVMPQTWNKTKDLWIHLLISKFIPWAPGHMLDTFTALAEPVIGPIAPLKPVAPDAPLDTNLKQMISPLADYVVCHPCSRYQDKNWSKKEWTRLFEKILESGKGICLTGGPSAFELEYIRDISADLPSDKVISVAGKASFGQTGRLIKNACAFVGVDTATAHIAAATGVPSFFLFGPTPVRAWGPSPKNGRPTPFSELLDLQSVLNVTIIRQDQPTPCDGCSNHLCAHFDPPELSRCMQSIPAEKVWRALSNVL